MRRLPLVIALLTQIALVVTASEVPDPWLTVAERTDFRATASYAETMAYLRRVESAAPAIIRVTSFGASAEGRELPLVIVSSDGAFTPAAAAATGKPILLLQSCIHAGEVDGKDASLMLLREIALGRRPDLAEAAVTLFVPIYNLDGHERVSPYNRPDQDGPVEGMGFRTTTAGLNLNRDFLRLASPEAQALAGLVADWRPHLHVDNHVTDGADHAWVLTWMVAEAPLLDPTVDAWVAEHLPRVLEATAAAGHPNGPYLAFVDWDDPTSGVDWADIQLPRYSTGYFPLVNRPSILVEMHSHKPYRDRVLANRDFMDALILEAGRAGEGLVRAVATAEARTRAVGAVDAEPSSVVVRWTTGDEVEPLTWPSYRTTTEPSFVTGSPLIAYHRDEIVPTEVTFRHTVKPELELARPRGYLVHAGWPQLEAAVAGHHLLAYRLAAPVTIEVETIRVAEPVLADRPFQGTVMVTDFVTTRQAERREVPAGSLWIPADQPDFAVAVQLFEPEAPDSLLRWGVLNAVFEMKSYIGPDRLEEAAAELLADDAVRAEWQAALADPSLAGDPRARYLWWFRRTPYWDERFGLLPVYRVMGPPLPAGEPWPAR
ncbi:MAG: M14 family metallopeptidase [Thermoanaerobaculales bacterium]|jgi:hypothetical protein|nr:M14 family metallopeptidase [Thermoanaerobaculales bacterium]